MTKPHILQIGSYPEGDQRALDAAFDMRRYFEAADKAAFRPDAWAWNYEAGQLALARRSDYYVIALAATLETRANLMAHFVGRPLLTPV
ncbi:hypothetical protein [Tabrizicola sp. BL-A-41-H6]|uniref:hypothetical protein n=1 Tax=Tabrizicola sp. BL-A-41-H6 TaxID=3421107 RepID=UPI003D66D326